MKPFILCFPLIFLAFPAWAKSPKTDLDRSGLIVVFASQTGQELEEALTNAEILGKDICTAPVTCDQDFEPTAASIAALSKSERKELSAALGDLRKMKAEIDVLGFNETFLKKLIESDLTLTSELMMKEQEAKEELKKAKASKATDLIPNLESSIALLDALLKVKDKDVPPSLPKQKEHRQDSGASLEAHDQNPFETESAGSAN